MGALAHKVYTDFGGIAQIELGGGLISAPFPLGHVFCFIEQLPL